MRLNTTFTYTNKYTDKEGHKHTERQENIAESFQIHTLNLAVLTSRIALAHLGPSREKKNKYKNQLPAFLQQSCKEAVNLPAFSESKCQYPDTAHIGETNRCQKMKTPMRNFYQTCRVAELNTHKQSGEVYEIASYLRCQS